MLFLCLDRYQGFGNSAFAGGSGAYQGGSRAPANGIARASISCDSYKRLQYTYLLRRSFVASPFLVWSNRWPSLTQWSRLALCRGRCLGVTVQLGFLPDRSFIDRGPESHSSSGRDHKVRAGSLWCMHEVDRIPGLGVTDRSCAKQTCAYSPPHTFAVQGCQRNSHCPNGSESSGRFPHQRRLEDTMGHNGKGSGCEQV
jgi:hypothetical protein